LTKEVRDNFDGLTYDEDESMEFTFIDFNVRNEATGKNEMQRVKGDLSRANFLNLYGSMVKKPKYERWVKAKYEDGKKVTDGYWEKIN
jgi:hypothetical protein